jgi:hypothetical protein
MVKKDKILQGNTLFPHKTYRQGNFLSFSLIAKSILSQFHVDIGNILEDLSIQIFKIQQNQMGKKAS